MDLEKTVLGLSDEQHKAILRRIKDAVKAHGWTWQVGFYTEQNEERIQVNDVSIQEHVVDILLEAFASVVQLPGAISQ